MTAGVTIGDGKSGGSIAMGDNGGRAITMCGVTVAMDSGGGDGRRRRDGSAMGNCEGAGTIAMGNGSSGAMDNGMTVQS